MAFRIPPLEPGGGVFWVNSATDIPARPLNTSVQRIAPRKNNPITVASPERHRATTLVTLRIARRLMCLPPSNRRERAPFEAHEHQTRGRDDHEGDDKQDRTQAHQRGWIESSHRFREFVRDGSRDGRPGSQ